MAPTRRSDTGDHEALDPLALPERRKDDQRLRQIESRYHALVDAAAQIVWTTRADGTVADMPHWRAYTGQSVEEVAGWGWLDAVHPDDRERTARAWAEAVATRNRYESEHRVRRHDGVYRTFLVRGVPVLDDGGNVREWVGFCTDITERTRAEQARRASEETFRLLFASNPQPMWVYDLHTLAFLEVNEAAVGQYGYTRDEFLQMRITDIRPAEDVARVVDDVRQPRPALQFSGAWRHRRKDGTIIDVEITSHTITFAGRAAALVSARDITDRKRAEAALRASEERLRTVIANAPIVLFAVDRDGVFTLSEGLGLNLIGIQPGEHVGRSYFELYAHRRDSVEALQRVLSGEATTTINEFKGVVFETRWMPTTDAGGTVTGAIGVSTDITERRRAEQERAALERRTHEALDALLAMAGVLVGEDDHSAADDAAPRERMRAVGRRMAELTRNVLGCRRVSITSIEPGSGAHHPLAVVGLSSQQEEVYWASLEGTSIDDPGSDHSVVARLRAGEPVLLDVTQPPLRDQPNPFGIRTCLVAPLRVSDQLVGLLALDYGGAEHAYTPEEMALADAVAKLAALVIERERLLHEREEARANEAALREANRRMDEFLGIAGHEMRTPLTTITGHVQLVRRRLARLLARGERPAADLFDELAALQERLERADAGAQRLNRLVGDLLDVSRIQAGRLQIRPEPCDLAEIVREVVQEHRQVERACPIRLEPLAQPTVPVMADAERIGQVVTNYLSNALKYSPPDRPITVGLEVNGDVARVWVRDEGAGLPAAEHDRVWERFYRAVGVEHQHGSSVGLGLGLHISKTIVEQHQGQVGVESAPGMGATFWFTLPLAERV